MNPPDIAPSQTSTSSPCARPQPRDRFITISVRVSRSLIVTDIDPALDIDTTRADVIVGEVKTAEAELNRALLTPGALHAALRRTGDLYSNPLDQVVDNLIDEGWSTTPTARVRVVGFAGYGHTGHGTTIHLGDAAQFISSHLHTHHDLYRVTRFSDPVVALLELLEKVR